MEAEPPDVAPEAFGDLLRAGAEFARQWAELEASMGDLRNERDEAIRQAVAAGVPLRRVGAVFGLSHQRIGQIVERQNKDS